MITKFFRKSASNGIPHQIYGGLMAQARNPVFYRELGIPDTVMGRFDMLAMHTYLFSRRLKLEEKQGVAALGQEVFDLFVADIERALRELGIGDTTVPKRKKKLVHSFYAQIDEFDPLLAPPDRDQLRDRVNDRYLEGKGKDTAGKLSDYMIGVTEHLAQLPADDILRGEVSWPNLQQA